MNQLVQASNNAVASADDYYARLAAEAQTYNGGGDGYAFLKFNGNDGYYSYGAENNPLDAGTEAAVDMRSFKRGWICWKDGQVKEELMYTLEQGAPPPKHTLTDHGPYAEGDGWAEQKTIVFKTFGDDSVSLLFQANNSSKMRALEALVKDFARQFQSHPGEIPVITLDANEFEAKPRDGGRKVRKWAPKFAIVDWMSEADLLAAQEGSPEDYAEDYEDEPALLTDGTADAGAAQEEVAEEVVEEAPAQRGGRRPAPAAAGAGRAANTAAPAPAPAARPAARPAAAPAPAARPAPTASARPAPAAAGGAARPGRRF